MKFLSPIRGDPRQRGKVGRRLKIGIGVGAAVVLIGFALLAWFPSEPVVEMGFHRATLEDLPSTASDISFYRDQGFGGTFLCEFKISKSNFEALAGTRGWIVIPLSEEKSVPRYTYALPEGHSAKLPPYHVKVSDGLFFEKRQPNNGGISVLFDESQSTAYIFWSHR